MSLLPLSSWARVWWTEPLLLTSHPAVLRIGTPFPPTVRPDPGTGSGHPTQARSRTTRPGRCGFVPQLFLLHLSCHEKADPPWGLLP